MKQHTCELCHTIFNRKEHLIHHINKLRKCNIETDFECTWCSKSFSNNSNLSRHINICKVKCKQDELEKKIQDESQLTNNRVEELEAKYKILEDKVNTSVAPISETTISGSSNTNAPIQHSHNPITTTTTTTTNSHNTTNNITTINNYGHEDLSHITLKRITFVFSKSFSSVVECVKLKHFSPHAPQNKNVCIKDMKSKYAYVFCDGNWDIIGRKKLIDNMYIDICEYIQEKLDELIDELSESVIFHIKRFLNKKDEDEYSNNIKTDLRVLLFNKRDTA